MAALRSIGFSTYCPIYLYNINNITQNISYPKASFVKLTRYLKPRYPVLGGEYTESKDQLAKG